MKPQCSVALEVLVVCCLVLCCFQFLQPADPAFVAAADNASDSGFVVLKSNSTFTEPVFNPTTRQIVFTVTGPDDTSGYMWCTISETLVPDHNDFTKQVTVSMDGTPIDYMYSFDEGAWELFFEYTHSAHEVVVSLPAAGFLGFDFLVWAAILIGVSVLLVAVSVFWRKKKRQL